MLFSSVRTNKFFSERDLQEHKTPGISAQGFHFCLLAAASAAITSEPPSRAELVKPRMGHPSNDRASLIETVPQTMLARANEVIEYRAMSPIDAVDGSSTGT